MPFGSRAACVALIMGLALAALAPAARAQEQDLPPALQPVDPVAAEGQLQAMTNQLRAQYGLRPLQLSRAASEVGLDRSWGLWECRLCSFDHQIPGVGFGPDWIITQVRGAIGAGENLGVSQGPNDNLMDRLFQDWVESPAHLENLLRPQWTHMGLGIVEVRPVRGPPIKVVTHVFIMAGGPLSHV